MQPNAVQPLSDPPPGTFYPGHASATIGKEIKRTGSSEGLWGQPRIRSLPPGMEILLINKALRLVGSTTLFFTAKGCHILIKADISMSAILIKLPNADTPLLPWASTFRGWERK